MSKIVSFSLVALLALSLTSCGDDKKTGASSQTPTAPTSSAPTTPATTPSSGGETVVRTKAQLTKALPVLADLPTGFSQEADDPADSSDKPFSSKDSKCRTLVKYLNADVAPGSKASVARSFAGGQEGPYIDFGLDAMGDSKKVLALQATYRSAVRSCKKLTMKVAGQGSSPMEVRELTAPQFGDDPFAFKLTGISGPLQGKEFTAATAGVDDVIVSVSLIAGQQGELDGATETAVGKAKELLSKTGS